MPNIGAGNISKVRFAEQGVDVAAPAATFSVLYLLASGVLRVRNAAATVYQYVTTAHDHSGTTNGPKLTQANSHESPDTDSAPTALHHTTGTGANQAAVGNHTHAAAAAYVYSQIIFSIEGANLSATGVKPLRVYAPLLGGATATILGVRVAVNSSPGATALRMDVHKDGSTILNTTAYVEVGVGAYTTERTTDFVAPGTFVAGAYFQIEVVQGDATAADCTVAIEFKYQAPLA